TVLTHGEWTWLLAVPGGHLSTPAAFRRFDEIVSHGGRTPPLPPTVEERQRQARTGGSLGPLAAPLPHALQSAACAVPPAPEPVREAAEQRGPLAALVSGSGPTIAILGEDEMQARTIAAGLMGDSLVESCLVARGSAPGASVLEEE